MTDAVTDDPVQFEFYIDAEPAIVWQFWVDPARMVEWWGTAARLDPRPGGEYRVEMDDAGFVMVGSYVELHPYERLAFLFGWEGGQPVAPNSTRVDVTLVAEGGGTRLTLRHSGLPVEARAEHGQGWAHFLPILASRLAH